MKTLEDFKQEQMQDEDFKREYDEIQFIANSRAIQELEKIEADFEEIKSLRDNPYNNKTEYSVSMKELRAVFEKHISELKGE